MRYLSLCAVIKNERPYLKEWIDFNLSQGFEHLYLYDNESTDKPQEIIQEYGEKITWHVTSGLKQQRVAYNHTITEYRKDSEFVAFLDADEFIFSTRDKRFVDTLRNKYDLPGISGIAVHWVLYGSSGHETYSPEPVTKRFTMRAATTNGHVKSVMRMADTYSMGLDPHSFRAHGMIIDENFAVMPVDYAITYPATSEILRINHMVTKSREEYKERKKLNDANSGELKDFEKMWEAHNVNEIRDTKIWSVIE